MDANEFDFAPPHPTPCFYSSAFAFIRGSNTGLDLPELCIASPIIRWADNKDTRMDPRNGLCLSATYDKAPSPETANGPELVEGFEKREGQLIWMPEDSNRRPLQDFLEVHRKQVAS